MTTEKTLQWIEAVLNRIEALLKIILRGDVALVIAVFAIGGIVAIFALSLTIDNPVIIQGILLIMLAFFSTISILAVVLMVCRVMVSHKREHMKGRDQIQTSHDQKSNTEGKRGCNECP